MSLVEAVIALQEQRDQSSLAEVLPPQTSTLPGASRMESAAAEAAAEPLVSVAESDRHVDASTSAAAAGFSADIIGHHHQLCLLYF